MKTVVAAAAVDANLFPVPDADPVGRCVFAADLTDIRVKNLRFLRQVKMRLLHVKELLRGRFPVIGEGLLPAHALRLRTQHQAHRPAGLPVVKGKGLLAR